MKKLALLVTALALMLPARAQTPEPNVTAAADGIFAAFATHPLVGMGDDHGLAQQLDFYAALIRDPRFAQQVGNLVVEFGGASAQPIIDRYVAGENVPYAELRRVWTDVVGWNPTVTGLGYANVFATVRAVNAGLPPAQRIRVWLGEPPIDWTKITAPAEVEAILEQRDSYPAALIKREILARGRKALVIYGFAHFGLPAPEERAQLAALAKSMNMPAPAAYGVQEGVERDYPGAFFIITPYGGVGDKACWDRFEAGFAGAPLPALAPVKGTALEQRLLACYVAPPSRARIGFAPGTSPQEQERLTRNAAARQAAKMVGASADALLYLGPAAGLTSTPVLPDIYLDAEYRAQIDRQLRLKGMPPMSMSAERNPTVAPRRRP